MLRFAPGILAFRYGLVPGGGVALNNRKGQAHRFEYRHTESRLPSLLIPQFMLCDGEIDLPTRARQGDLAYTKDSDKLWRRTATNWTDVSISTPQTVYYQTVQDDGVTLTQRSIINFTGAGVSTSDSGGKTVVTIAGGGGGGSSSAPSAIPSIMG